MRPVQHHGGPAVRTHHQPGIFVLLIHLGRAAPVLAHPLDDVPNLLGDQGRVGPLEHQALLFGMFHMALILVGLRAEPHVDGIAQIQLILQHIRNRAVAPVIGLFRVQGGVTDLELLIGIGGRAEDLLLSQLAGDLARPAASGAHGKDATNDCGGFFIHYQLFFVVFILSVAIGRSGSDSFPALRFSPQNGPNLAAGVPNIPFVEQIFEGHQLVALAAVRVYIVVDGDVADTEHGEALLTDMDKTTK